MQHTVSTLYGIQTLRFLAALLVVVYHVEGALINRANFPMPNYFGMGGQIGVDVFFVISGFIIALTTSKIKSENNRENTINFMVKRVIRIVPVYWFYTFLKIVAILAIPSLALNTSFDLQHILGSLFFIPTANPVNGSLFPVVPVGWSLNFEMLFYLIFAVAIFLKANKFAVVALAFSLVFFLEHQFPSNEILSFFAHVRLFEFFLGMIAFDIFTKVKKVSASLTLAFLILSVSLFSLNFADIYNQYFLTVGLGSFFMVLFFLYSETWIVKCRLKKIFEKLGDASFTLYLSHGFVVPVLVVIGSQILNLDMWTIFLSVTIMSVIAGQLAYELFEKPTVNYLNTKWKERLMKEKK